MDVFAHLFSKAPVIFRPFQVASYSNFGWALLGRIIERASGLSYEAFLRQHLLAPLGMHQSVISPRDPAVAGNDSYWSRVSPQLTGGATLETRSDTAIARFFFFQVSIVVLLSSVVPTWAITCSLLFLLVNLC